eukprot:gene7719-9041_t
MEYYKDNFLFGSTEFLEKSLKELEDLEKLKATSYEIVIGVTTIEDLINGWQIYIASHLIDRFKSLSQGRVVHPEKEIELLMGLNPQFSIVAVVGKTFLVNLLTGYELLSGKKEETKGLSFKQTKVGDNMIFLDTAGTETPLDYYGTHGNNGREEDMLAQKKSSEMLTQEVSFALADIVIIVVSELTWPDQQYITVLKNNLANYNDSKGNKKTHQRLIVVHNFSSARDESTLITMWRKYVVNTQQGVGKVNNLPNGQRGICFEETEGGVTTFHYLLAQHGSPIGIKVNPVTIQMIKLQLASMTASQKRPSIYKSLIDTFGHILPKYCKLAPKVQIVKVDPVEEEINNPDEAAGNQEIEQVYSDRDEDAAETERVWLTRSPTRPVTPGYFKIVIDNNVGNYNLELKHSRIEYSGHTILLRPNDSGYTPKYDVLELADGSMTVTVDLPGYASDKKDICGDITVETRFCDKQQRHLLTIKGTRKLFRYDPSLGALVYNDKDRVVPTVSNRQKGEFILEILIPPEIDSALVPGSKTILNGVYNITLKKKIFPTNVTETDFDIRHGIFIGVLLSFSNAVNFLTLELRSFVHKSGHLFWRLYDDVQATALRNAQGDAHKVSAIQNKGLHQDLYTSINATSPPRDSYATISAIPVPSLARHLYHHWRDTNATIGAIPVPSLARHLCRDWRHIYAIINATSMLDTCAIIAPHLCHHWRHIYAIINATSMPPIPSLGIHLYHLSTIIGDTYAIIGATPIPSLARHLCHHWRHTYTIIGHTPIPPIHHRRHTYTIIGDTPMPSLVNQRIESIKQTSN